MEKVKKAPINRAEQIEKTLEQTKTIAKQLLKEMVALGELEDDGKTKGKLYKIIRRK